MSKLWCIPPLNVSGLKTTYFRHFSTTSQLNGNFNGEYLQNETRHRKLVKGVGNWSPTVRQTGMVILRKDVAVCFGAWEQVPVLHTIPYRPTPSPANGG